MPTRVAITKSKLDTLANTISAKSGEPILLTIDEMTAAVKGISTVEDSLPVFTIEWPDGDEDAIVTCNKTYAELYSMIDQQFNSAAIGIFPYYNETMGFAGWITTNNTIQFLSYFQGLPNAEIDVASDGTMTFFNLPERLYSTLNVTNNGNYNSVSQGLLWSNINVNIPTGTARTSSDITVSGATVTIPAGLYSTQVSKSVASGTAGTPFVIRGTVSNNSITLTPNVNNLTGYITGGTKTGTAVTVSASELVSGTFTVDSSGTKNVTNYASISVPAGTAGIPTATKGTVSNNSISITPSVTNASGFITGSTNTGSAVTVSASELVSGNKEISTNGTNIDVTNYATVSVDVTPIIESLTVTPSTSQQVFSGSASQQLFTSGSCIGAKTRSWNSTMPVVGVTYSVQLDRLNPDGYVTYTYEPFLWTATSTETQLQPPGFDSPAPIYISASSIRGTSENLGWTVRLYSMIDGYLPVTVNAVSAGSVTAPSTISGSSATVSTGTNTLTLTKTISVTPSVTTAGYVSEGTAGNSSVSLTASITTQGATTYNTSSSDQTIAAGTYLTGTQTIRKVTTSGIDAANIKDGTVVQVGDAGSAGRIANVTGTFTDASTVSDGQTAATSSRILRGYSAWVNGDEIKGNIATITMPTSASSSATSGYTSNATISRSTSDQYINIPKGYNASNVYYKINAIPNGTAGTPTATKGSVSNNSITVTPSVTNTTGYITGGTVSGSAVTVSASELVSGTKSITSNGTNIDVTNYAAVDVSVSGAPPVIESLEITPSETAQTYNSSSVDGYKPVTIAAVSSTYVGSGITRRSSTDLTASGATVTVPAGYYSSQATKSVTTATLPTSTTTTKPSGTTKLTIDRSTSTRYLSIPAGYQDGGFYTISAVANGTVTAPSSISGTTATISTGTNTLTLTKTVSVTPSVTTAGYVSAGTAGNSSVSLTASVTTKAAATITPGTTNQTIAAGTYLTGTQTISGDADLVGSNILSTANIFGVQGTVVVQHIYSGSSAPSSSTGANGDVYIRTS